MRVFLGDVGLCIVESVEGYSSLEERSEGEEGVGKEGEGKEGVCLLLSVVFVANSNG